MSKLRRTRQGKFIIKDSYTLEDVKNGNYKILTISDVLKDDNCVIIDDNLYKVIKYGGLIENVYKDDYVTFVYQDNVVAIYKTYDKDKTRMKPYKMFI